MDLELLQAGIDWWLGNQGGAWGADFLNGFYGDLYRDRDRSAKLDREWWQRTVQRLSDWRAVRSRCGVRTKTEICERGLGRLDRINEIYQAIRDGRNGEPTLGDVTWEMIGELFDVMRDVKDTRSPVFPSKLAHFLLPRVFVVVDNMATSAFSCQYYQFVWRGLKQAWAEFAEQEEAKKVLTQQIQQNSQPGVDVHPHYPFETKIPELCLIGYAQQRTRPGQGSRQTEG